MKTSWFKSAASALALALALAVASPAKAVSTVDTTLSTTVYGDLGAGPIVLGASGGNVFYQIADAQPPAGTPAFVVRPGDPPVVVPTTSHIWALGSTASTIAIVAPYTSSGGGGGGTSSNFNAAFPAAGTATGAKYSASPPTLTDGNMVPFYVDVNGNIKVNVVSGGGANASVGATGSGVPGSATYLGGISGGNLTGVSVDSSGRLIIAPAGLTSGGDPCSGQTKTNLPIATAAGNLQLAGGVAAKRIYICSIAIVGATAWIGNLIEGTGAACTTAAEAAVIGSTTAANGMAFPANGGMTYGSGQATVASTATAANGLCLLQSGTAALAGNITYVQQ